MMWLVNLGGILCIAGIVWWFWLYKPKTAEVSGEKPAMVTVENGVYQPARIQFPANRALALEFFRKDASPCAEMVIFPDLAISQELAINKATPVRLPPLKPGNYEFHCQMNMYRGELVVM